jgi:hypothetical protein
MPSFIVPYVKKLAAALLRLPIFCYVVLYCAERLVLMSTILELSF